MLVELGRLDGRLELEELHHHLLNTHFNKTLLINQSFLYILPGRFGIAGAGLPPAGGGGGPRPPILPCEP